MFKKSKFKIVLLAFHLSILASCSHVKILSKEKKTSINKTTVKPNTKNISQKKLVFKIKPGEMSLVKIENIFHKPSAIICSKKNIPYEYNNKILYFVVAESYFSKRKRFQCQIVSNQENKIKKIIFNVVKKKYPEERLNVDKKRVVLSAKNLKRYLKEKKILIKRYHNATRKMLFDNPFIVPLQSKITSYYGARRIFNNLKKTQHLGNDFRAKTGTPIPATNSGRIIFAGDLFFTGGTVIINHGLNIFSVYGHLSKLKVKTGDMVKINQVVALSGASGRVTGPHLHWGIKIDGHYINGFSLVNESVRQLQPIK